MLRIETDAPDFSYCDFLSRAPLRDSGIPTGSEQKIPPALERHQKS
jgi:hypothetical protein